MLHRSNDGSRGRRRLPQLTRRVVGSLLLVACGPSLLLNVGPGRGLLIHGHGDEVHTHLIAAHADTEPNHRHDDHYGAGRAESAGKVDTPPEPCHHDAVIPGSEIACAKQSKTLTDATSVCTQPLPPILATSPSSPPAPNLADPPAGAFGPTDLACLRVVILLI